MGFIKKWRKIIIAVVVFVGILGLTTMFSRHEPTEVPTPDPTQQPISRSEGPSNSDETVRHPLASTESPTPPPLPTEDPIPTPIPVETPGVIPTQTPTPQSVLSPTLLPEQTQSPELSPTLPPEQIPPPVPPPTISPTIPPEEEKQDVTQPEQEDACALGHDFSTSVWETATCLKSGYYNNICRRCGLVESVTEEPLPHDVEDILIQEGNCMQDTVIKHICKSCGQQVQSDTRYTPEIHKWCCTVIDNKEVVYCEWCGIVQ